MRRVAFGVAVGVALLSAALHADEVLMHGRLTQEGANFIVTDDRGERTVFTEIWKPHKIGRAVGKDEAFWFRVQRAGKAPNYRLRLMEAYAEKPPIAEQRLELQRQEQGKQLQEKIDRVRAEGAAYRWEAGKINSSRGAWTREGDAFVSGEGSAGRSARGRVAGRIVPEDGRHHPIRPVEVRQQVVVIAFSDAASAEKAWLEPLPIYGGYEVALTCRWDDSDVRSALLVSQVGAEQHVPGTCFLNGVEGALCQGKTNQPDREAIRKILERGSSIGNHAYTHPSQYTLRSRNRQFWEAMKCRAEWEAAGDCLISTVAPPYNRYGDEGSMDLWLRSGHYGFINNAGRAVEKHGYADLVCDQALIVYGTHARGEGRTLEAVRDGAGRAWAKVREDRRIWTPNFNQFAAYRLQYEHTGIEKRVEGGTATFTLYRPAMVDLNDAVPITLVVGGVDERAVRSVAAGGAGVDRIEKHPAGGAFAGFAFNLKQGADQFLPEKIGFIENARNAQDMSEVKQDGDFPELRGLLHERGGMLHLRLENRSDPVLEDVILTYRIPQGWDKDVVRRRGITVAAGRSFEDTLAIARTTDECDVVRGRPWFYVQVDFRRGGVARRLYLATSGAVAAADPRRAAGHFLVAGPIRQNLERPGAVPDPGVLRPFGEKILQQARAGEIREWQMRDDGDTYAPDVVQVAAVAANDESYPPEPRDQVDWYAARGVIESSEEQMVYVRTGATHLMLNGEIVRQQSAGQDSLYAVRLKRGRNELVLAVPVPIRNITSVHGFTLAVVARVNATAPQPATGVQFSRP